MGRHRTSTTRSEFGKRLGEQLAQLGLEPAELAEQAGLSPSHVYQLLRGDRADPRATTLRKIASVLELNEPNVQGAQSAQSAQAAPAPPGQPVEKAAFFAIMSAFPTGVTIVSTLNEQGQPRGLTCTALSSLSAEPPLLLICVDKRSHTLAALRHSRQFVVNYLLAGRGELSNRFASTEQDKWTAVAWRPTRSGLPWLHADAMAYAECKTIQEVDGGDHVIIVGRVDGGQPPAPGTQPLMYFRRSYGTWRS